MNRNHLGALTVLGLLAACQPQPLSQADQDAIRALATATVAAENAGNVEPIMAAFASDAVLNEPGMAPIVGTDAMRRMLTGMLATMKFNETFEITRIAGAGNLAYASGTYHAAITMKDSTKAAPPPEDGKWTWVLRRQADKSWKVVAAIGNSNSMPAAPQPPARGRRH